jgi:hypothetical protein
MSYETGIFSKPSHRMESYPSCGSSKTLELLSNYGASELSYGKNKGCHNDVDNTALNTPVLYRTHNLHIKDKRLL